MTPITLGQWFMTAVYVLLVVVWLVILIKVGDIFKFRRPPLPSVNHSRIKLAVRIVAVSLLLDSLYWAATNITEVVLGRKLAEPGISLRNPILIGAIKTFILGSAIFFYYLVEKSSDALSKEFEEAYFSKMANFTWDAIGILDREGHMKIWNKGAEKLFGWKQNEVLNRDVKEFLVPLDLHDEFNEILNDIRTNHKAHRLYNTIRRTAHGERIPVDVSISPIMDPDLQGFFGIMRKASTLPFSDFRYFTPDDDPRHSGNYIFVAMSFSSDVVPTNVWSLAIRDAIEENNFTAVRADHDTLTGTVINQIYNDIRYATLVIADLTGKNPNVFYEVGLAHMLGKPVIQLLTNDDQIPFDIAHIRTIKYSFDNLSELREKLITAIRNHLAVHQR